MNQDYVMSHLHQLSILVVAWGRKMGVTGKLVLCFFFFLRVNWVEKKGKCGEKMVLSGELDVYIYNELCDE
jgi:hypothetical protein